MIIHTLFIFINIISDITQEILFFLIDTQFFSVFGELLKIFLSIFLNQNKRLEHLDELKLSLFGLFLKEGSQLSAIGPKHIPNLRSITQPIYIIIVPQICFIRDGQRLGKELIVKQLVTQGLVNDQFLEFLPIGQALICGLGTAILRHILPESLELDIGLLAYFIQRFRVRYRYISELFFQRQHISNRQHDVISFANDRVLVAGQLLLQKLLVISYLLCLGISIFHIPCVLEDIILLIVDRLVELLHALAKVNGLALLLLIFLVVVFVTRKVEARAAQVACCEGDLALVQQGMFVDLLPLDAVFWVVNQTALDEVHGLRRYIHIIVFWSSGLDVLEYRPVIQPLIRQPVIQHLIKHHPNRPYIRAPAIPIPFMYLRRHSLICPQLSHSQGLIPEFLGKPQISDLTYVVVQQHIGQLEIPMHGVDFMEALEPVEDLFQAVDGFTLRELAFLFAVLLEVSTVAELCDDKDVVPRAEGVDELDHVLVLDLREDLYLGLDQFLQLGNLFHLAVAQDFYCVDLVRLGVDRLVDCAV